MSKSSFFVRFVTGSTTPWHPMRVPGSLRRATAYVTHILMHLKEFVHCLTLRPVGDVVCIALEQGVWAAGSHDVCWGVVDATNNTVNPLAAW